MEDGLSRLEESINNKTREIRDLRSVQREKERLEKERLEDEEKQNKTGYEQQPYENELQWLRDVSNSIYTLKTELESVSLSLANSPILVIKGEPGCGNHICLGT